MAGSTFQFIEPPEVFAPEESDEGGYALDAAAQSALAQNPWRETQGEPSLHDWLIGTSDEWRKIFSLNVGQWVQVIIQWAKDFIGWIKGQFEGVPQSAKTMGSGMDLMHCNDAIAQFIGAQLVAGAQEGRVLSEGNWPHNLGGRIIAHGGALIEMVNLVPVCKSWKVRNTLQVGLNRGLPALEYRVGPLPPPSGAPYTQPVIVQGFFAPKPLDPIAFQNQWGVPPPTPSQLKQLLISDHKVAWNAQLENSSTLAHMRNSFRDLWILAWKQWLEENIPPTPGQPPPPPNTTQCTDPCEIQVINELYSIALQINAGNTASMAIMQNLPALLAALNRLSTTNLASVLQKLVDCVCPNLDAIAKYLAGGDGTPLHSIVDSLGKLAGGPSSSSEDLKRIADSAAKLAEKADVAPDLIRTLVSLGAVDPDVAQAIGGTSPGEAITAVLTTLAKGLGWGFKEAAEVEGAILQYVTLPLIRSLIKILPEIVKGFLEGLGDEGPKIADFAKGVLVTAQRLFEHTFGHSGEQLLKVSAAKIRQSYHVNQGDPDAVAGDTMGLIFELFMLGKLVLTGIEMLFPTKELGLADLAETLLGIHGVEGIAHAVEGPLHELAIHIPAQYKANAEFRSRRPDLGRANQLYARRLISLDTWRQLVAAAGMNTAYEEAIRLSAFGPLSPRMLASAVDDTNFDPAPLREVMRFSGHRDQDIDTALDAFRYKALKSLRQEVIKSAEANFVAGIADEAALDRTMTSINLNDEAKSLIKLAATQKRLKVLADDYKRGWDYKAAAEEIDAQQYRIGLAGIGYTSPIIDALVSEMADRMGSQDFKAAALAAREEEREDLRLGIRAAQTAFREGEIEAVGFTAALLALGVHPHTAALYLALAEARGVVSKAKAKVARTEAQSLEIKAAVEQFKKGLIDQFRLEQHLRAAGMSPAAVIAEVEYLTALAGSLPS